MPKQTRKQVNEQHKNDTWFYLRKNGALYFQHLAGLISSYGNSVLDVGCGEALIIKHLPKNFRYVGLDLSDFIITRISIKKKPHYTNFIVCDMYKPNLTGWYDIILFAGTFTILHKTEILDLVRLYAAKYKPKYILIADIKQVDLSLVKKYFKVMKHYLRTFPFLRTAAGVGTPEQINNRQILLIKV